MNNDSDAVNAVRFLKLKSLFENEGSIQISVDEIETKKGTVERWSIEGWGGLLGARGETLEEAVDGLE